MALTSVNYLVFLMAVLVLYFAAGKLFPQLQWSVLLIASIVFYSMASWKFFIFLLISALITWADALAMDHFNRKYTLAVGIILTIGILAVLKYSSFASETIRMIFPGFGKVENLIVPLGISFYTFQGTGYCIDVYRCKAEPEKNFLKYFLFLSFFPQICQGPIGRYNLLSRQLCQRNIMDLQRIRVGSVRILLGFFKKIVVANQLGMFVDSIYSSPSDYSGIVLLIASFMYTIQIYMDFSGYTDIAIGSAQCFGIILSENFRQPYFAGSVRDFWKRWHISLTSWFRDYLYIPLGGSRVSHFHHCLNILIVFCISGIWHGPDWSFVLWGLAHGVAQIAEMSLSNRKTDSMIRKCIRTVLTFIFVNFAWILFKASDIREALLIISRIFTRNFYFGWSFGVLTHQFDLFFWIAEAIAVFVCLLIEVLETKEPFPQWILRRNIVARWGVLYLLILPVLFMLVFSNVSPSDAGNFIYFNF